jgi:hypothetical protein
MSVWLVTCLAALLISARAVRWSPSGERDEPTGEPNTVR